MKTQTRKTNQIEASLKDIEKLLNVRITIIDKHGSFHSENGEVLLGKERQSHQKNEICHIGFCHECVMHCRHEMNDKGEKLRKPFIHKCWKGVSELLIPLISADRHYGSLYAGIWRDAEKPDKKNVKLSSAFFKAWEALPMLETIDIKAMENILTVYARGMLALLEEKNSIGTMFENRKSIIRNFIFTGASEKLKLEELAKKLHLSNSRTSHTVKSIMGKSFQELLIDERIKRAKTLLLSTDCTSGEISGLTGFYDEYYFNRTFKKICGTTPGGYRRANKHRKEQH